MAGGSSLANAIKRKTHKERSQPAARRKFGLLEKKKDYLLRARDYHRKERAIKHLQAKAEARNPDEFYFAMQNARTRDGVHVAGGERANKYSQAELLLMKTQDAKYLEHKSRTEAAKAERLRSGLHFIGLAPQAKHTVFVDSARDAAAFEPAEFFDTPAELLGRAYNRPRRAQLEGGGGAGPSSAAAPAPAPPPPAAAAKAQRRSHAAYKELSQRLERGAKLAGLAAKMAYDKAVMSSRGRKRKLAAGDGAGAGADGGGGEAAAPAVFRWKRERRK